MGDEAKREPRWHATMREAQVKLLDEEASVRGLTRSEMFLVAITEGIDQLRLKRMMFEPGEEEPLGQSEPKASTSPAKSEAPAAPVAKRPAKPRHPAFSAAALAAADLVVHEAPKTPAESQPAASTDAALAELGITPTEVGENPFDSLNEPVKVAPAPEREVYENPFDALN